MVAVTPYSFHRDPLFWIGCAAYAINRWLLKTLSPSPFLHSHFSDVWLVPCVLPLIVALHRRMGWRDEPGPPTWGEVVVHLMLWSVLFEGIGPHLSPRATGDVWDVACYALGGLAAVAWWRGSCCRRGDVATGFDRLAPHYRWMEAVAAGPLLQRSRTVFLEDCDRARRILVLGVGRGRFVAALRERNPAAHITAVDASARMLELARADLAGRGGEVTFVHSDILSWE
ncbi:MAG: class I SAM-dependent methyltransferase, partial [Vicinamibacterales bacterium]